MIWLTGIVAVALMLAVLELDPSQLYAISSLPYQVGSERWQLAAYLLLLGIILLRLGGYLSKSIIKYSQLQGNKSAIGYSSHQAPSQKVISQKLSSLSLPSSNLRITPWTQLNSQGLSKIIVKLIGCVLLLLAVLCNSVAQRMAFIESSPQQTLYVEAVVTPVGLSDKRLEVVEGSMLQGYRQLVALSDIKFTSIHQAFARSAVDSKRNTRLVAAKTGQLNPFNQPMPPEALPLINKIENSENERLSALLNSADKMIVMLQSYQPKHIKLNDLSADKQLRMKLVLKPLQLKDKNNKDEFDEYRWLSSRHATAKAFIVDSGDWVKETDNQKTQITKLTYRQKIDVMRFKFREHFLQLMSQRSSQFDLVSSTSNKASSNSVETQSVDSGSQATQSKPEEIAIDKAVNKADPKQSVAVTLSLLTGDRSLISDDTTALYRFGGISHLLAISGTHVLFLAILSAAIATTLINKVQPSFYNVLPRWQCGFIIAVITAFGYALFAGFDVPAVRTACMLLLVGVMRYFLAVPAIFKMLLILAVAMAWSDIFVLWQAGFWLSFIAVAVLVAYSQRLDRNNSQDGSQNKSIKRQLFDLFKLQLWMSLALLPISLWLFGKVSLWGFGVNLIAIGLFGWVIVPLNLLACVIFVVMPSNALPSLIWSMLFSILDRVHQLLLALQNMFQQSGWLHTEMSLPVMGLLLLMVLPWLLPKAMLNRMFSLVPLIAIGVLLYANPAAKTTGDNPVHISILNPNHPQLAASLIHNKHQAWLLVSTYEKEYQSEASFLTVRQQKRVSEALYDQLKKNNISHLTGIIGQTETAALAPVVAQLHSFMPVSYYWQAGINQHKPAIDRALLGLSLQAQSCHRGQQSSIQSLRQQQEIITEKPHLGTELPNLSGPAVIDYSSELLLTAITGWNQLNDSRVWDCAIELATTQSIYLKQQGGVEQLFSTIKGTAKDTVAKGTATITGLDGKKSEANTVNFKASKVNREANRVLLYSSAEPQLGTLWPLICTSQSPLAMPNNNLNPKLSDKRDTLASNQNAIANRYWLTPSQAIIETTLVDSFYPKAWKITGQSTVPAKPQLIESHLYWQQLQSMANFTEK